MNIYSSVDMEGITGLVDRQFVTPGERFYERGQQLMTDEVNHVAEAAFAFGCKRFVVNDSHGKMNNLLVERLLAEIELVSGEVKPYSMVQGLDDSFDGAFFIGYHSRASMPGVMSHTMIFGVRSMWLDGHEIGEMGLNAYLAGYYGVPVLLVAGDDQAAKEAEALIPNVTTAIVKTAQSRSSALCLTPAKSKALLQAKTKEALMKSGKVEPLIANKQPVLHIEFANYGQAEWAALMPGAELETGTTVKFAAKDVKEAYQAMLVMTELAMQTTFC
ncbi:M55 family metallopeptidase [Shouchella clausii]|uniref:Aminopeptidase n=1 Tax=Shouchella clausii TaxID=79880 RepID=A0A268RWG4_SHOCL|nr:M55 family metallopeptidase [Shouchella clausii]PAD41548.1 aminopeptidase [Bacillus sp. 7520-S]SPU21225.1 D-alanyl-aminopeptidase [Niallia circulans]AST94903.1 aminopeptidase [Shouchella clausii]MBU8598389.1 M55 family metallopeptidase [Shouchella clausii]MCM3550830.1 M55 family metallopeptidase [Shouchella clausii]